MDAGPIITDARPLAAFKTITFSNFKRQEVKKEYIQALLQENIDHACFWSAELLCSGLHFYFFVQICDCIQSKIAHLYGRPR